MRGTMREPVSATSLSVDDVRSLAPSWAISLRARNLAEQTFVSYTSGLELLTGFLLERGMPTSASAIRREHVEAFLSWMLEPDPAKGGAQRYAHASARNRYTALDQFFKWTTEEGEITESPMRNIPGITPEVSVSGSRTEQHGTVPSSAEGPEPRRGRRPAMAHARRGLALLGSAGSICRTRPG